MEHQPYPVRRNNRVNIIFFLTTTLGGLVAAPIYMLNNGVAVSEIVLLLFFVSASAMGITVGYQGVCCVVDSIQMIPSGWTKWLVKFQKN